MTWRLTILLLAAVSVLAGPLTPGEKRGRHIYQHGESPAGREITALAAGAELGASIFACGTCHGPEGRGVAEGTVEPSDIRWASLQKVVMTGRKRPRYDEERLARAIREGHDPAGNRLSPVMPRFRIGDADLSDLIAYLKRLGDEPQPGLAPDSITVTTAVPGALTRAVLEASLKDINAAGGIFGRTLKFADVPPAEAFAVIGAAEGVEQTFDGERVPLITPFPTASPAPASFFLFADLETQVLALAKHAGAEGRTIHVVHDGTPAARAAMKPTENAKRSDGDLLFLIGAGVDVPSILRELKSSQWKPRILIAGAPVTAEVFDAEQPILIAAPALPSDLTDQGRREIIAFAERHALPTDQLTPHIATLAAVKVLVEGLKRSGRELTREKLIASLEELYQFPTGMTPPVSFARNRHVGTSSVHVLAVDREKRAFVTMAKQARSHDR